MKTTFLVLFVALFSLNSFADVDVQIRGARSIRKELTEALSKQKVKVVSAKSPANFGVIIKKDKYYSLEACKKKAKYNSQFYRARVGSCAYKVYKVEFIKDGRWMKLTNAVYSRVESGSDALASVIARVVTAY